MTLAGMVLGYASVGFAARCYALGIQKRNIFENLGGHAMSMAAFGAVGYYFYGLEGRQNAMIQQKKQEIQQNRARLAELQAAGAEALKGEE